MMVPYSVSCGPSVANSAISQDEQSKNLSLKIGVVPVQPSTCFKQMMTSQFQDQESSSTQSTGQSYSYPEVHRMDETNQFGQAVVFAQTECTVNDRKATDGKSDSAVSMISQDSLFSPPQFDYKHSLVCLPLHNAEPYFGGFMATYGLHQSIIPHPNVMGMAPSRVPLPFDPVRNKPIYVNPKQYNAILRRREHRAKLEAQSKLSKDRKPYLHESRHLHALRRVRGTGGRFLPTKKLEEESPKPGSTIEGSNSRNGNSLINRNMVSATSRSDVTTENMFPNSNSRFSDYVNGSSMNGHKWSL